MSTSKSILKELSFAVVYAIIYYICAAHVFNSHPSSRPPKLEEVTNLGRNTNSLHGEQAKQPFSTVTHFE